MAENLKPEKKQGQKSGQKHVSRISGKGGILPKPALKLAGLRKAKRHTSNIQAAKGKVAAGNTPDETNWQGSSIISNKAERPEWQMTAVEKMDMVRAGVNKKDLESLKEKTKLDYDKLSTLLSTTRATLINKKGKDNFSTALGERIVSIADLYSFGFEVFEDEARFNEWVFRPNRALGGKQPFELLDNQFGREEVKNVIGRIAYGVFS